LKKQPSGTRRRDAGWRQFVREVDAGLQRVAESPNAWHPLSQRLRRYRLNRFPYGIIYQVRKNEILVIAVAHLHRRPEYWRHRLKGS
jgi:toxin ParE2